MWSFTFYLHDCQISHYQNSVSISLCIHCGYVLYIKRGQACGSVCSKVISLYISRLPVKQNPWFGLPISVISYIRSPKKSQHLVSFSRIVPFCHGFHTAVTTSNMACRYGLVSSGHHPWKVLRVKLIVTEGIDRMIVLSLFYIIVTVFNIVSYFLSLVHQMSLLTIAFITQSSCLLCLISE